MRYFILPLLDTTDIATDTKASTTATRWATDSVAAAGIVISLLILPLLLLGGTQPITRERRSESDMFYIHANIENGMILWNTDDRCRVSV